MFSNTDLHSFHTALLKLFRASQNEGVEASHSPPYSCYRITQLDPSR